MFECSLPQLVSSPQGIKERAEGVALLLKVAKSTYPISSISLRRAQHSAALPHVNEVASCSARWQTIGRNIAWEQRRA